jgi:methionine-rich copper-binding protein CopC
VFWKKNLTAAVLFTLLLPTPAFAHSELISSTPSAGAVVEIWPSEISLTFNEELQNIGTEKSNFVVVNNAVGDQISADDEKLDGSTIKVSLDPNTIEGPVLVYYRVVSADGHPVEGEYKFNFGKTSVTAEGVQETEKSKYPIGIYIASALFITTSLFFGIYAYRRRKHA